MHADHAVLALLLVLLLVQAAQIFRKMVEVVNHCHELGVMHR
jgi:serine/threonine protein kinase